MPNSAILRPKASLWVDRGVTLAADFDETDLTADGGVHTLDLSDIVPPKANMVLLKVNFALVLATFVASIWAQHGTWGTFNDFAFGLVTPQPTDERDGLIQIGSDGLIDYLVATDNTFTALLTVRGWII